MQFDEAGKVVLNDQEAEELHSMIVGIASRYNGWAGLDRDEDIVPELWCKCLKIINRRKMIEPSYLARACFNTCIDLFDKAKRNRDRSFPANPVLFDTLNDLKDDSGLKASANNRSCIEEDYTRVVVDELLSLFPKDSREYTYIEMNIQWSGLLGGEQEDIQYKGKGYRSAIACGFASDTSSGYRSMVWRVRDAIKDYYTEYKLDEDKLSKIGINDILALLDNNQEISSTR